MADIQFWRSNQLSDTSFLDLVKRTFGKTFTKGIDAKNWLVSNGYYTTYPDIVTDGLVLYLDAANSDSFKGEPTTNLVTNPSFNIGSITGNAGGTFSYWSFGSWDTSNTHNIIKTGIDGITDTALRVVRGSSAADYFGYNWASQTTVGNTYTWSALVRGTPGKIFSFTSHWGLIGNVTLTNKFTKYSFTFVRGGSSGQYMYFTANNLSAGDYVDITNVQVEQKSYATHFVNGTRGTTYATNGGWCDISGNGNHGELLNSPTYNSDNLGNVVFNGTSYIPLSKSPTQIGIYDSSYTAECVCYPTDLTGDKGMFGGGENATNQGLHLVFRSGGIYLGHYSSDYGAGSVTINNWYHIVFRFDKSNGSATIFKNGVSQGSGGIISPFVGNGNMVVGASIGGSSPFVGKIAISKIYTRALSDSEILQNFNSIKTSEK